MSDLVTWHEPDEVALAMDGSGRRYRKGIPIGYMQERIVEIMNRYHGTLCLLIDEADNVRPNADALLTFLGKTLPRKVGCRLILIMLTNRLDWEALCGDLIKLYKGKGLRGRPPYKPELTFKMLFLSYLYSVSERQMGQLATYHLAVKWFLGLAVDEPAPDHSTLTKFKDRLICFGEWDGLEGVFDSLVGQAIEQGLEMGHIQILDSVHTQANVNNNKDGDRQDQGQGPHDPDAQVIHKGRREVVEPDGRRTKKQIRYKGYKLIVLRTRPISRSTRRPAWSPPFFPLGETRPITRPSQTSWPTIKVCNCPPPLMVATGPIQTLLCTCDDTDIYERLEVAGLHSGICLRRFRREKKDRNTDTALHVQRALDSAQSHARRTRQEATAQRYRVEQPFGPAKQKHGFERCRYIGLLRYRIQSLFTFRPQAKGRRAEVFRPVYANLPWA